VISEVRWDDVNPWPLRPDGEGPSLTLIAPERNPDPSNPLHWRPSTVTGGTPGFTDATTFSGDPLADADGDGLPNLAAYALGLDLPGVEDSLPTLQHQNGRLLWRVPLNLAAEDVRVSSEWSPDLSSWHAADPLLRLDSRVESDATRWHHHFLSPNPVPEPVIHLRVRVERQ
jgi:hypothetical protein